jgi:hypothetical protein
VVDDAGHEHTRVAVVKSKIQHPVVWKDRLYCAQVLGLGCASVDQRGQESPRQWCPMLPHRGILRLTHSIDTDAAAHRLLECIRQFDASSEWYAQGAVSCAHWLSWRIGLDLATAREKVRVARTLGTLPAIDQALRVGRISYAKVRAMTRVATPANEAQLLEFAIYATGAQLERIYRGYRGALAADRPVCLEDRSVRRRVLPGGMVKVEMVLSPYEADLVMRAIDCARAACDGGGGTTPWSRVNMGCV